MQSYRFLIDRFLKYFLKKETFLSNIADCNGCWVENQYQMQTAELAKIFFLGMLCLLMFFFVNSVHSKMSMRIAALKRGFLHVLESKDAAESDLASSHRHVPHNREMKFISGSS